VPFELDKSVRFIDLKKILQLLITLVQYSILERLSMSSIMLTSFSLWNGGVHRLPISIMTFEKN
jgi:hypothetical protein